MLRRKTRERNAVLNKTKEMFHPTAEEIYVSLENSEPKVSRATVYRNLAVLTDDGSLKKIVMPYGPARYDGVTIVHSHFQCRICQKVFDLPAAEAKVPPEAKSAFIEGSAVTFYGVCENCLKKNKN